MALPKFASDLLAERSKRSLTMIGLTALALLLVVYMVLQIKPVVRGHLEAMLRNAGFETVTIGDIDFYPSGFRTTDITLDPYGFDTIKSLSASVNWPRFLMSGKVSGLEIKDVSLSRDSKHFGSAGRQLAANLLDLPPYRIQLTNLVLDLDTGFGAIRLTMDATAEPGKSEGSHNVQARINADQYQLGFQSTWQGTLNKDGALDLTGNVVEGRLNLGPLRISRFNGWAGTTISSSGYTLQSQLEAGSASFMNVPLQNISMVNDSSAAKDDVIVRSGISGMPDILFTADLTRTEKEQNFVAALKGKNLGGFLDYIDEVTKADKTISQSLTSLRDFEIVGRFQPEKRFVGGPMPFAMTATADGNTLLDGNVLFYPDTFEVRGSLEAKDNMASALQSYFKIPSANIVQNFIRLDGDARAFFGLEGEERKAPPKN